MTPPEQFFSFSLFFHQDALIGGASVESVARTAAGAMSADDRRTLDEFFAWLGQQNDEVIAGVWNSSRSDFILEGNNLGEFVRQLKVT